MQCVLVHFVCADQHVVGGIWWYYGGECLEAVAVLWCLLRKYRSSIVMEVVTVLWCMFRSSIVTEVVTVLWCRWLYVL